MNQMDNNIIQDLFENLQVNMKLSKDVLRVLEDEAAALKEMNTARLFKTSKEKGNLLVKIQYIDNSIQQSIKQLEDSAHRSGRDSILKGAKDGLSRVAEILPKEKAEVVLNYRQKLSQMRQRIQDRNLVNKRFTEDTLGMLGEAMSLITGQGKASIRPYGLQNLPPVHKRSLPSMLSREV